MGTPTRGPERRVPVFGRSEVLDRISARLDAVQSGRGGATLLVGGSGVGKTVVLEHAVREARGRGFVVLSGRGLPSDLPQPFHLLEVILRSLPLPADQPPADQGAALLPSNPPAPEVAGAGPMAQNPAETLPRETRPEDDVARLMNRLMGPPERAEELRSQLFGRLSDGLTGLARTQPVLLSFDDVHLADESSLSFLREFLGQLGHLPIAILATSVPSREAPPRFAPLLEDWMRAGRIDVVEIRPLDESEFDGFVRWLTHGRDPGTEALRRWFSQTEGNPLFTEQVVRGATGLASAASPPESDRIPKFDEVLRGRVDALAEPERRLLVYAAVLGKEFDFAVLAAASGAEEERLSESLERLVRGGILRERSSELYEFVSDRVRTEVYSQLTETRRRILHRKAGAALAAQARDDPARIYELARHSYLGGDAARGIEFNRRAAERASLASAYDVAVVHLERALEMERHRTPRDPSLELALRVELGRVLDEQGDLHRSEAVLVEALDRARSGPPGDPGLALALIWLARTRSDLGLFAPAQVLAREAYQIFEITGDERGLLIVNRVLGVCSWRLGELDVAERHLREELRLSERIADARERGHAMVDLANVLIQQGGARAEEAMKLFEAATVQFSSDRDASLRARVLMNQAVLLHGLGRFPEATKALDEAVAAAEASRSRMWIGYCRLNQAQFRVEAHDPVSARAALGRSRQMMDDLGDALGLQQITMIQAMIEGEEKKYDEAEQTLEEALRMAQSLHLGAEAAEARYRGARLAFARGDIEEARRRLKLAVDEGFTTLHAEMVNEAEAFAHELGVSVGPAPDVRPP